MNGRAFDPTAYARCVERVAGRVVVVRFFSAPASTDAGHSPPHRRAAARFPQSHYHVTPTLGIDDLILDLLEKRAAFVPERVSLRCLQGTPRSGECAINAGLRIPRAEHRAHSSTPLSRAERSTLLVSSRGASVSH